MGKVLRACHPRTIGQVSGPDRCPPSYHDRLPGRAIYLQLFRDIITPPSKVDVAAILAPDLTKAFDRVYHTAILKGLESISPGQYAYKYARSFATSHTAVHQIGDITSEVTPQGAVLSPPLFNLAMLSIPHKLDKDQVPNLQHSLGRREAVMLK